MKVTVAVDIHLQQTNLQDIHIPHHTLPLTRTHLLRLATNLHQPNMHPLTAATIFHYMTSLGHPTNCQPKDCLYLHLNHLTHAITPHTYDHHPALVTINLHLTSNNSYVIYTSISPNVLPPPPRSYTLQSPLDKPLNEKDDHAPQTHYRAPHTSSYSHHPTPLFTNKRL